MDPVDWELVGETFERLLPLNPEARETELALLAAPVRTEIASLLRSHDQADGFFEERIPRLFGALAPSVRFSPGERILHFEIIEFLGEGSSASVYLARDTELERAVALKITLSESREARTLANFNVDGIVRVYSEHLVHREGLWLRVICLQYIAGTTLAVLSQGLKAEPHKDLLDVLDTCARRDVAFEPEHLKWREGLSKLDRTETFVLIGIKLAETLALAHARGVLHLDIKPANILIDAYGRAFLSDFNVSTAGDILGMGGTPRFMPPEQMLIFARPNGVNLPRLDGRADVYALGVLLKDLVAQPPPGLNEILARATLADRDARFAGAREFGLALRSWLRNHLAERDLPPLGHGFNWMIRYPFIALVSFVILLGAWPGLWLLPRKIAHQAGMTFAISLSLGLLISLNTSLAVGLFVMVRALYPRLKQSQWAAAERFNGLLRFTAAMAPLGGVLALVLTAPATGTGADFASFKHLIFLIGCFGLLHFLIVQRFSDITERSLRALKRRRSFD